MQLEIGMSTKRYLPASGTAGLDRSLVKGKSRVPAPPPIMTDRTLLVFGDMRLPCIIKKVPFFEYLTFLYPALCWKRKRHSAEGVCLSCGVRQMGHGSAACVCAR